MINTKFFPLVFCLLFYNIVAAEEPVVEEQVAEEQVVIPGDNKNKRELTQEEIDRSIGRYGELEEIPEGFKFSDAEEKLWRSNHLENIEKPVRLYYEFVKSGTYEEGFTDSVFLDIIRINEDGTKNALLDFFTGDRKQSFSEDNTNNITGNPVLGIYMQGDVLEMNRLTSGHWRHFQKSIKIALRQAKVEPISFEFNGNSYDGEIITFLPYLKDPHRNDFLKFADKRYEFIMSDKIPGTLFQIRTVIPDKSAEGKEKEPLIEEKLTLVEINYDN